MWHSSLPQAMNLKNIVPDVHSSVSFLFVSFLSNTTSVGFHLNDTRLCSLAFNFIQQKEDSYVEKKKYIYSGKPIIMII